MFDEDPQDTMESDAFGTENGGAECIWTAEWTLLRLDVIMA
jgi:hypothetical protein